MSAFEDALNATRAAMRAAGGGATAAEALPEMVVAAVRACRQEQAFKAVRLLRVQAGDIVVFHFDELISESEQAHFQRHVGEELRERHPDVQFLAADRVSDITVVRPQGRQERREELRVELETLEAEQLMKEARGDD